MFIRQLRSYSPHQRPTTPGKCGETWQSIAFVLSRLWISAMRISLRSVSGNPSAKSRVKKMAKVLLSLRAVRERGIAVFESFSELIGLLLGSGQ